MRRGAAARLLSHVMLVGTIVALGMLAHEAFAQTAPLGALRQAPTGGLFGWLLSKQALFYRELSGLIRAAKTDGSAVWGLIGISFIYGIFHAAGPGHGKAVISSYLLANQETWRRGIALSFASALLQAITAVVVVAIVAILIGATAKAMGDTVRVIEVISYALIVLVGARLLWMKGRAFAYTWRAIPADNGSEMAHALDGHVPCTHHDHAADQPLHAHDHDHHAHPHGYGHDHSDDASVLPWGHAHGPEPQELAGPGGWRRGLSAIVAVGLRPCSGAIIVLVFALAQGLFWAGVASTFVMGVGTAITVAAIATLAVGAKTVANRIAATRAGCGTLVLRGVEVGAAIVVTLFGVLLLTGTIASERMGMF